MHLSELSMGYGKFQYTREGVTHARGISPMSGGAITSLNSPSDGSHVWEKNIESRTQRMELSGSVHNWGCIGLTNTPAQSSVSAAIHDSGKGRFFRYLKTPTDFSGLQHRPACFSPLPVRILRQFVSQADVLSIMYQLSKRRISS